MSSLQLCDRIQVDSSKGSIRYIGKLSDKGETIWCGIEWEASDRGKRKDGIVNGTCYFDCQNADSSVSFIKLEKLKQIQSSTYNRFSQSEFCIWGSRISLFQALFEKYFRHDFPSLDLQSPSPEFIQKALRLSLASLRNTTVAFMGQSLYLFPNLKELDLANTLLSKWNDLIDITTNFPDLEILDLSNNYLFQNSLPGLDPNNATCFKKLNVLVLNEIPLNFSAVQYLLKLTPNLQELYLHKTGLNQWKNLGFIADSGPPIRLMDLSSNNITNWLDVQELLMIPSLQTLNLAENSIDLLEFRDLNFSLCSLTDLNISGNNIKTRTEIHNLAKISSLQSLRITYKDEIDSTGLPLGRWTIIALIPQLTKLNGGSISAEERKNSEIQFLNEIGVFLFKAKEMGIQVSNQDTDSFNVLSQKHAFSLKRLESSLVEKPGSNMISLQIFCTVKECNFTVLEKTKKFPRKALVGKIKTIVIKLFGLKGTTQDYNLWFYSSLDEYMKNEFGVLLQRENEDLIHYGLGSSTEGIAVLQDAYN